MDAAHLKNQFEEQGFLFLSDFFDNRELKRIKEKVQNYILNIAPGLSSDKVFYEDADDLTSIKQLFHLSDYDVFFKDLLRGSKLEDLARVFFGEDTGQGFVEYFNKPPGIGQPTPPHQDCYYFMLSPPKALTFWIPLEDVDEENGCLRYVRGARAGYSDVALDKLLWALSGRSTTSPRLRWPYIGVRDHVVEDTRKIAQRILPDFFQV